MNHAPDEKPTLDYETPVPKRPLSERLWEFMMPTTFLDFGKVASATLIVLFLLSMAVGITFDSDNLRGIGFLTFMAAGMIAAVTLAFSVLGD